MPSSTPAGGVLPGPTRRSLVAALAMSVVMALLLPITATAGPSQRSAAPAGAHGPKVNWAPCGPQLECASVPVPLDWAHPSGPTITLSVLRHLASHPEQRIGSLFLAPSGPGDSGVAEITNRGAALDAMTQGRFDIVGWDIRGSWGSAPVRCFADASERASFWQGLPVPTTRQEERRYLAKTVELAQRCGARNGALLAHIATADTARDLDYLRRLVGDRQLTVFGESFGTLIGQTYANLFPRRVRAMALDGLEDPVASAAGMEAILASGLADTDRVFRQFLALCQAAGPDRCALAGHGEPVAARVARLLARLRHAPLPAPSTVPPGELTYGETLTVLKLAVLADPSVWPLAAAALEEAAEGDGSTIKAAAESFTSDEFRVGAQEQSAALICADSPARQPASAWPRVVDRLEAVSRIGGPVVGWLVGAPCASWPTPSADRYTGPWNATTRNPILVIGTRFDPTTPLRNARLAARRLGNAVLLVHDGYGHLTRRDPSTCITQALGSYLVNLTTPPSGTICPADRLPFDPDFGQPVP
jgi:pimeloyl-ACP methyl ester carboxylesterase